MLILLLSAKFYSVSRNCSKIVKQRFNNFRQPVFCQTNVACWLSLSAKLSLYNFSWLEIKRFKYIVKVNLTIFR